MAHVSPSATTIELLAEIPEELNEAIQEFLKTHPNYDQNRVFAAALSLFLLQNGCSTTPESGLSYRRAARIYMDNLFKEAIDRNETHP